MTEIINLNECILSRKNGMYGGAAEKNCGGLQKFCFQNICCITRSYSFCKFILK